MRVCGRRHTESGDASLSPVVSVVAFAQSVAVDSGCRCNALQSQVFEERGSGCRHVTQAQRVSQRGGWAGGLGERSARRRRTRSAEPPPHHVDHWAQQRDNQRLTLPSTATGRSAHSHGHGGSYRRCRGATATATEREQWHGTWAWNLFFASAKASHARIQNHEHGTMTRHQTSFWYVTTSFIDRLTQSILLKVK